MAFKIRNTSKQYQTNTAPATKAPATKAPATEKKHGKKLRKVKKHNKIPEQPPVVNNRGGGFQSGSGQGSAGGQCRCHHAGQHDHKTDQRGHSLYS